MSDVPNVVFGALCIERSSDVPRLSIVIPSHNRADLLRLCLASIARHAPDQVEVIVVDDASPGGAVSTAAATFDGIRILKLSRRGGFCVAANAGVGAATSSLVEILNDDTEVTPGWADAALAAFARPDVGAVAPLVLKADGDDGLSRIDSAGDRYFIGGVAGKRGHGEPATGDHLHAGYVFGASGAAAFYRREAFLRVGGFPEEFGAYFDDVDLSFRLHRAGWRVWYEPAARVHHRVSASHGRTCRKLLAQQSCNEERVFWRNLPAGALARALPWHVAVLLAKAWRRWRCGELLPFLRGRLAALAELPQLLRQRRRLAGLGPADVETWELDERYWE
jgi:GT2 family glycosyltransferase